MFANLERSIAWITGNFDNGRPLLQTSFLPDFMHVYVLPAAIEESPVLLHLAPALTAAFAGINVVERARTTDNTEAKSHL
jgi:hypothetical protein